MPLLPGVTWRESEFPIIPNSGGQRLHGACGPNALASAESWASQQYRSTLSVYARMHAAGRCDGEGVSNMGALYWQAVADGFRVAVLSYQEPMPESVWRDFATAHIGAEAIVCQVSEGCYLQDAITGARENANINPGDPNHLQYHFILLAGFTTSLKSSGGTPYAPGWFVCDGDNFATPLDTVQTGKYQYYFDGVLSAALPVAMLAVYPRVAMPGAPASDPTTPPAAHPAPTPTSPWVPSPDRHGWWRDTRTGAEIGGGLHDYALMHGITAPCLVGEQPFWSTGDTCAFFGIDGQPDTLRLVLWSVAGQRASESPGANIDVALAFAERYGAAVKAAGTKPAA